MLKRTLFFVGLALILLSVVGFVFVSARFPRQTLADGIASGIRHQVRPGETLDSIGQRYGTSPWTIVVANNLTDTSRIAVGQELYIPLEGQVTLTLTVEPTNTPRPVTPTPTLTETPTPTPTGTPTSTPTRKPTNTPRPPTPTVAFARTPVLTATPELPSTGGGPTEPPAMVEAEWPKRMEMGRSDSIRVALVSTIGYVPIIEIPGHSIVVATPIPVGTPQVPLEEAFGPDYEACGVVELATHAFEFAPATTDCLSLGQPKVTWVWTFKPKEPGDHVVVVNLYVRWRRKEDQSPPTQTQIWYARMDISVEKPLVPTNLLNAVNWGGALAGLTLTLPWVYEKTRGRRASQEKLDARSHALFEYLCKHFSLDELRTLCFDLEVDHESLAGEGKEAKARELVLYLQRRGELDQLTDAIQRVRGDAV